MGLVKLMEGSSAVKCLSEHCKKEPVVQAKGRDKTIVQANSEQYRARGPSQTVCTVLA